MVKFGKYLLEACVPEWQPQYINYRQLKKALRKISNARTQPSKKAASVSCDAVRIESAANDDVKIVEGRSGQSQIVRVGSMVTTSIPLPNRLSSIVPPDTVPWDEEVAFFDLLQSEIEKVKEFFQTQEKFFESQVQEIQRHISVLDDADGAGKSRHRVRKIQKFCREVYRGIGMLQSNFCDLNYVAIAKILKKHDKISCFKEAKPKALPLLRNPHLFPQTRSLDRLRKRLQVSYSKLFRNLSRTEADESLRMKPSRSSHTISFVSGVTFGLLMAVIVAVGTVFALSPTPGIPSAFFDVLPVYRAQFLVLFMLAVWGAAVAVFQTKKINFGFIVNASPLTQLRSNQLILIASTSLVFVLMTMTFFLIFTMFRPNPGFNPGYLHFAAFVTLLLCLFCPFNIIYKSSRFFFLRTVGSMLMSPLSDVKFQHFFMADFATSTVRVLFDIEYSVCYYVTGAFLDSASSNVCFNSVNYARWVLAFLPFWWRFAQCIRRYMDTKEVFPHLANAGKYGSALAVTFFNLLASSFEAQYLKILWIVAALFGTMFAYWWDIVLDWGLLQKDCPNMLLRENIMFSPITYYFAMVSNFFLRVSWVLSISPSFFGIAVDDEIFFLGIALLEICRRGQWCLFRVENEYLNNCGNFRVVNVVPPVVDPQEDFDSSYDDIAANRSVDEQKTE